MERHFQRLCPPPEGRVLAIAAVLFLSACAAAAPRRSAPASAPPVVDRGCPPEREPDGDVRLVFLGDSGYGTGASEWGTPGQEAVANVINELKLPPDFVFFLGDNIYWSGSANLYKTRFDDIYDPLIRQCKAHVALGNHDVKGCRTVSVEEEVVTTCLQKLSAALVADRKAQYVRQGMDEAAATSKAEQETRAETEGPLADAALASRRATCLAGDASAYVDQAQGTCNAEAALEHAQFGFGALQEEGQPSKRQRYYSLRWPVQKLSPRGVPEEKAPKPLVDVLVLDSNTLRVDGSMLGPPAAATPREDRLQLLWLRSHLKVPRRDPKELLDEPWTLMAMHHPPHTPRSCACLFFGKCVGGHADAPGLKEQLKTVTDGLRPPDIVLTAHNHIYARSRALDPDGRPVEGDVGGSRYFVTGGGGAPLYAIKGRDERFVQAITMYHFLYLRLTASSAFFWAVDARGNVRDSGCFEKGSSVDHPLGKDFKYDDALPPHCTVEGR